MDVLTTIYIIVSLIVIIFETWYISRLRKSLQFALYGMNKLATAVMSDDPAGEMKGINWDDEFKNFK